MPQLGLSSDTVRCCRAALGLTPSCRRRIRWRKLTTIDLRRPNRLPREFVGQAESVACDGPRLLEAR